MGEKGEMGRLGGALFFHWKSPKNLEVFVDVNTINLEYKQNKGREIPGLLLTSKCNHFPVPSRKKGRLHILPICRKSKVGMVLDRGFLC